MGRERLELQTRSQKIIERKQNDALQRAVSDAVQKARVIVYKVCSTGSGPFYAICKNQNHYAENLQQGC